MGAGNLMVAAAILFCGITFTGISNLAKLLNLACSVRVVFINYRRNIYFLLYIYNNYLMQQDAVLEYLRGNNLQLSGGDRCDSPGYSTKYCTYSLMDSATDLILDYKLIQSSETRKG